MVTCIPTSVVVNFLRSLFNFSWLREEGEILKVNVEEKTNNYSQIDRFQKPTLSGDDSRDVLITTLRKVEKKFKDVEDKILYEQNHAEECNRRKDRASAKLALIRRERLKNESKNLSGHMANLAMKLDMVENIELSKEIYNSDVQFNLKMESVKKSMDPTKIIEMQAKMETFMMEAKDINAQLSQPLLDTSDQYDEEDIEKELDLMEKNQSTESSFERNNDRPMVVEESRVSTIQMPSVYVSSDKPPLDLQTRLDRLKTPSTTNSPDNISNKRQEDAEMEALRRDLHESDVKRVPIKV
jgi:hypothetical protein